MNPLGTITLPVTKNKTVKSQFEVLDIDQSNILSGGTAAELGLIVRLHALKQDNDTIPQGLGDFPEMTQTTGTLPGKYTIKVDATAQEVVHPVRHQPAPLRQQVVDKLHEMEKKEVITPVQRAHGLGKQ